MQRLLRSLCFVVLLAGVMSPLAGCGKSGKSGVVVSGKASYKGKKLGGGQIVFHPSQGATVTGGINPDGTFSVPGVPAGPSRVTIETESIRSIVQHGGNYMKTMKDKVPEGMKVSDNPEPTYVPIPRKYADPNTSGLTWDVTPENKSKDFDLTD